MTARETRSTKCKYMPSKAQIKLAQTLLSEASFRYFSRWATDNSGYEIIRDHDQNEAIPYDNCQEWMPVMRCIAESELADEWCQIFTLAEHLKLAEVA